MPSAPNTITMPALPQSTSDIRASARANNRTRNHNAKWSRGTRAAPGQQYTPSDVLPGTSRPLNRDGTRNFGPHYFARAERASIHSNNTAHRQGNLAKKGLQTDLSEATQCSDTGSSDEEVTGVNDATVPTALREGAEVNAGEVMYSFDAPAGPSDGADILSNAVMQAVKRYENKQTEQLVKTEYDMVHDGKEWKTTHEEEEQYAGDAEDDFEMIGHGEFY